LQTRVLVSFTVSFSFDIILGPVPTTDHKLISIVNHVRFQTSFVPQFLPPEHEPAQVQITQQWADRRTLWSTPTFIPVSRAPTLVSSLIRFFDRSFHPHLDQMEHVPVHDSASYRLHKLGMRKSVKVGAEIRIYDFSMASVDQLVDVSYCRC